MYHRRHMKVLNAQFIQGVVGETAVLYDGTPHIAFIGRSNVGKSSTLNTITGQRKLVKVGQTPGKTKEINFFRAHISDGTSSGEVYLVDLPGYGYAKISKERRNELKRLINWYLTHPQADTKLICLIIDAKVGLTDLDYEVIEMLRQAHKRFIVAVNKVDKLNQKSRHKLTQELSQQLNTIPYVFYSASTKKHVDQLISAIFS